MSATRTTASSSVREPRVWLFDPVGALVDCRVTLLHSYQVALNEHGCSIDLAREHPNFDLDPRRIVRALAARRDWRANLDAILQRQRECFRTRTDSGCAARPGASELVSWLRARSIRTLAVSFSGASRARRCALRRRTLGALRRDHRAPDPHRGGAGTSTLPHRHTSWAPPRSNADRQRIRARAAGLRTTRMAGHGNRITARRHRVRALLRGAASTPRSAPGWLQRRVRHAAPPRRRARGCGRHTPLSG
jgi:hypothetical protein